MRQRVPRRSKTLVTSTAVTEILPWDWVRMFSVLVI